MNRPAPPLCQLALALALVLALAMSYAPTSIFAQETIAQSDPSRLEVVRLPGELTRRTATWTAFAKGTHQPLDVKHEITLTGPADTLHLGLRFHPATSAGHDRRRWGRHWLKNLRVRFRPATRAPIAPGEGVLRPGALFRITVAAATEDGAQLGTHYRLENGMRYRHSWTQTVRDTGSGQVFVEHGNPIHLSILPQKITAPHTFTLSILPAAGQRSQSTRIAGTAPGQGRSWQITLLPARPNIILLMADDMGYGDSGYMGNPLAQTPNLDAMAKAGMRLDRFYSAAPVCSPTRGSVMTGRHPYRYGILQSNVGSLLREEFTLPEMFKQAGYRTGFFGKWHLGTLTTRIRDGRRGGLPRNAQHHSPPQAHGFDRVLATESSPPTYDPMLRPAKHWWRRLDANTVSADSRRRAAEGWWWPALDGRIAPPQSDRSPRIRYWNEQGEIVTHNLRGDTSRILLDRAVPFIEQAVAANQPFLAVVWFHTPHRNLVASDADRDAIATDNIKFASYHGAIHAMDRQIGRLRTLLRDQGIANNSLLWFTSDNGPAPQVAGNHATGGLSGGKGTLREGGIRAPTVVEWPGKIPAGTRLLAPGVTSDILPTVADLAGLPLPATLELDGISLKAPLLNQTPPATERYIGFQFKGQRAWVGPRYKLLARGSDAKLYDLTTDPQETTDLATQNPEQMQTMQAQLERWREAVAASWTQHSMMSDPEQNGEP